MSLFDIEEYGTGEEGVAVGKVGGSAGLSTGWATARTAAVSSNNSAASR